MSADAKKKPDPNLGRVLGGTYTLVKKLGEGGMGDVYKATQAPLGREVAIKVLKGADANPENEHYFMREVQAINMLRHPNIIQIIDFGRESQEGTLYLVMEYLPGRTLKRVMRKDHPLSPARICQICIQILSALEQAHRSNVVHCDLKPANVMLEEVAGQQDFVKVLDFGIAKIKGPALEVGPYTQQGNIVGTFDYMSPEQILRKDLDGRADLWSLGVILHEILTKKRIFHDKDAVSIIGRVMQLPIESPRAILGPEKVPLGLDRIVMRALERNSAKRWQSAAQMREAFVSLLGTLSEQEDRDLTVVAPEAELDSWLGAGDSGLSERYTSPSGPSGPVLPSSHAAAAAGSSGRTGGLGRLATGVAQGTSVLDQTFSIDALQHSLQGERRKVAVLSIQQRAKHRGMDPEEMAKRARQEAQVIKEMVEHHDGHLDSFMGGTYTVLFGLTRARVGDNLRALECAMAIQQRFGLLPQGMTHLGIGLCYGEVFVSTRRAGHAYGGAIDRCVEIARGVEGGRILVDHSLVQLTRQQVAYDVPRQVGGEPACEVLGFEEGRGDREQAQAGQLHAAKIHIKRGLYEGELGRRGQAVGKKQGGGVALIGAMGAGKSTLIAHFAQSRRELGWQAFEVHHGPKVPLGGVRQWIRQIAQTYDQPDMLIKKACESLGLKHQLDAVSAFYLADPSAPPPFPDQDALVHFTAAIFYKMMRFALKKGALLLCHDDLSLGDQLSLDFLDSLLERVQSQRVLVLVGLRLDVDTKDRRVPERFELLPLEGFTLTESKQYISQILGFMPPVEVLNQLHERASGNPMFLGELLHAVVREGGVQALGQAGTLGDHLPLHLHELLAQRLDELDDGARDVMAIASVLGEEFPEGFFAQITPAHMGSKVVVEELVALGFLEEMEGPGEEIVLGFVPRAMRAVVYGRLPKETRQKIHVSVIEFLEGGQAVAKLPQLEIPGVLAFHYKSLGGIEGAVHYTNLFAQLRAKQHDYDGAIAQYTEALELAHGQLPGAHPLCFESRMGLVKAFKELGRVEEAQGQLAAIELAGDVPPERALELMLESGVLGIESGSLGKSTEILSRALQLAKSQGAQKLEVRAMLALSGLFEKEQQLERAAALLGEVAKRVEHLGELDLQEEQDRRLFWTAYNQLGTLYLRSGDLQQALTTLRLALGRAQEVGDRRGVLRVVSNLGALCLSVRDVPGALGYFEQALRLARDIGDMLNQSRILTNMGIATMEQHDFDKSKEHFKAARTLAEEIGWYEGLADMSLHIKRLRQLMQ